MSAQSYQFDMNGMSPDDRKSAADGAQNTVHMEEGAGRTMAQKLLPVRDKLLSALGNARKLKRADGFGALHTGNYVVDFYSTQADAAISRIQKDLDSVQHDIDHFIAMELLYKNRDDYNANNFDAYKTNVVY